MSLITLIVYLIIVGALLYIVSLLTIDATIKKIIQVVVILVICIYLLQAFLPVGDIRIGR